MPFTISRIGHSRGRPVARGFGRCSLFKLVHKFRQASDFDQSADRANFPPDHLRQRHHTAEVRLRVFLG
jgi:hypothetical protein